MRGVPRASCVLALAVVTATVFGACDGCDGCACDAEEHECADGLDNEGDMDVDCFDNDCRTLCDFVYCGNGALEPTEECDGDLFAGEATCESLGAGSGTLACQSCHLDTDQCTFRADAGGSDAAPVDAGAATDGAPGIDAAPGTDATPAPTCGNGVLDATEQCEGTNLGGNDCTTILMGFGGGTLACGASCTFDVSGCTATPGFCGNGVIDGAEDCDEGDLGGATCVSLTGDACGSVYCLSDCTYYVMCYPGPC